MIYEVEAPDGRILEIEGPEGATEQQVLEAAAQIYGDFLQRAKALSPQQLSGELPVADPDLAAFLYGGAPAQPERGLGEKIVGAGEAALSMITGLPGVVTGPAGALGGLAGAVMSGEYGTPQGAQRVAQAAQEAAGMTMRLPRTEAGREYLETIGEAAEVIPPFVPMAGELAAAGRLARPVTMRGQEQVRQAGEAGRELVATGREAISEAGAQARADIADFLIPQRREEIKRTLIEQPDNTDVVQYQLVKDQVRPDPKAGDALKQGWKEGAVASIKAASPEDRRRMRQMLNIYKTGKKSERYRAKNRPADIVGKSLDERVKFVNETRKRAGQDLERVAQQQLRGAQVDYNSAVNKLIEDLDNIGVTIEMDESGVARANLKNSDIQGDVKAQRILNNVLRRISDVQAPDAYGVHKAKQFIDTQVSYGKQPQANPLSRTAEGIIKDFRRNLNTTLGDQFPEYREVNTRYADTRSALDALQKAVGTQLDFDSPNAPAQFGTASRRILSNYASRANMLDALDAIEGTSRKYGMKIEDDLLNQLIFVNELDRMFGAPADMTFKGQIAQAIQTGADVARGNVAQRAFELLTEKAERLRGINEDNAIKVMEDILNR